MLNGITIQSPEDLLEKGLNENSVDDLKEALRLGANFNVSILEAIVNDRVEWIQLFNRAGIDLQNLVMGKAPLEWAATLGREEIIQAFINVGVEIDQPLNHRNNTALHIACKYGHLKVVEKLIKAGANRDAEDKNGVTPIYYAVIAEQKDVFDFLLTQGISPDVVLDFRNSFLNLVDVAGSGLFLDHVKRKVGLTEDALYKISNELEKLIIEAMRQAKMQNKLLLIVLGEIHNCYKILQVEDIILNIGIKLGINHLYLECRVNWEKSNDKYDMATTLGMKVIGIDDPEKESGLIYPLIRKRNHYMANQINRQNNHAISIFGLAHLEGILTDPQAKISSDKYFIVPINLGSLNKTDQSMKLPEIYHPYFRRNLPYTDIFNRFYGNSQWVIQIKNDFTLTESSSILEKLNTNNYEVPKYDQQDHDMISAQEEMEQFKKDPDDVLKTGLEFQLFDLIRIAKELGADLEYALLIAVKSDTHRDKVSLLCQAGAHLIPFSGAVSPLGVASCNGSIDCMRALLDAGVQVNSITDQYGRTALHTAAWRSNLEMVKMLIEIYHADNNIKDYSEKTPLDIAIKEGHSLIVEYLSALITSKTTIIDPVMVSSINPMLQLHDALDQVTVQEIPDKSDLPSAPTLLPQREAQDRKRKRQECEEGSFSQEEKERKKPRK